MSNPIYCGRGKVFGKEKNVSISICIDNIPKEYCREFKGKTYVRLNLYKTKYVGEKHSHYLTVDTWKHKDVVSKEELAKINSVDTDIFKEENPFLT